MTFLTGIEIRRRIEAGLIEIRSLDASEPFSMDAQVTEDCIDLRLAPSALILREEIEYLDYVNHDLDQAYEKIEIPATGFDLQPLQPLITQALEAVCMPENLMGLVFTRSTFARMGIMANCMAPKFAIGIRWAFPLQLVNVSRTPVRIYPYAPIAQLLVSEVSGQAVAYRGKFQDTYMPTPPRIGDRERQSLSTLNPDAVNRTFHIINKDLATRDLADESDGRDSTPSDTIADVGEPLVVVTEGHLRPPPTTTRSKWFHQFLVASLGLLSALGFGICGNLLAAGSISYWQGVSIILMLILSGILGSGAYVLQWFWLRQSAIIE